jgi:PGF-pre-PGF domain-containing protein
MVNGMAFMNKRNKHRNIITALFLILFFCIVIIIPVSAIPNSWQIMTVDSPGTGSYSSLALNATGYPSISYYDGTNQDLKYARRDGLTWNTETVDSTGDVGQYTSLALDSATGNPRIAYYDLTNEDLKYTAWDGATWNAVIVDSTGNVGQYTSLKLTGSGSPRISYFDATNNDLKCAWYGTPVVGDFTATPTTGTVPLTVPFTDTSTGNPAPISWIWDFGDGTTSSLQNPSHVFNSVGTFDVSLTVSGIYGSNTKTLTNFITANSAPTPTPTPATEPPTAPSDNERSVPIQELSIATEPVNIGGNSAIQKATVTGKGVDEMVVTAMLLSTLPSGVPSVADPVYQYIDVTPAHFKTISRAVIKFSVPLSWIEEQQITPASIALARFQDGVWTYLPTTLIREENGHAYFQAESPGFSIFAIVAVKGSVIAAGATQAPEVTTEQISIPATTVAVPVTTTLESPRTSTTPPTTSAPPQKQSMTILLPLLGAGTALLLRRLQ